MAHAHHQNQHVHFNAEDDKLGKDNEIVVDGYQEEGNRAKIDVHLGFLQVHHRYEVQVTLPIPGPLQILEQLGSIHCRLLSSTQDEMTGAARLVVAFLAHKEKLLKEEMALIVPPQAMLQINFHARVLGKGKGTPLLKNGIRCIGVTDDGESEASDYQGAF